VRTVVHYVDSSVFGGAEKVISTLLGGLDRKHWQPVLVHHPDPALAPLLEEVRRNCVQLRPVPRARHTLSGVIQFHRVLRAARPAILHVHLTWALGGGRALVAATLARIPAVVVTAHSGVHDRCPRFVTRQIMLTRVNRFLAVSESVAHALRKHAKVPATKIQVVHNGIPLASYDRPFDRKLRAMLVAGSERPIVLTIARLSEEKGHKYLLDAASMVPEAMFVLAGDGPLRAELELRARALGLGDRVVFLGHREDIPDLLAICDLFVLPSLFEGYPLSVMEAAAARKPVIATAVGGTDEALLHGESGLLVPPADAAALANAIRTVLREPALAAGLADAAYARAQQEFSADEMCKRTMDVYEEVVTSRQ
jgi:glycosyltransferase involved in cell wall biosynthesis